MSNGSLIERFLLLLLLLCNSLCFAKSHNDAWLALVKLPHDNLTSENVKNLLGTPSKSDESKNRTIWYYEDGNSAITVQWKNSKPAPDRIYYKNTAEIEKKPFDYDVTANLKNEQSDLFLVVKLLGKPHDMTLKVQTQELHYAYQNKVLRLFFRNRTLIDYVLY